MIINTILRDSMGVVLLFTASLCVGLALNQFAERPLPLLYQAKRERLMAEVATVESRQLITIEKTGEVKIGLDEFRAMAQASHTIVLDARPEIFHRLGHVPGALSLPREDFANSYERLRSQLDGRKADPVLIYCSSASCEDSELVREALLRLGFGKVRIFNGGWAEWTAHGLPEETK